MPSRRSSTIARRAPTCAPGSRPCPISPARWRASSSAAADRAISPRSATAFLPRRNFPRRLAALASSAARSRAGDRQACAGPIRRSPPNLRRALADELPAFRRDGGFVRAGYEPALDEARALRDESRRVIAALQVRYAETTGIRSAEDPAQQCARLFRRRHRAARRQADGRAAQRDLHPSPDALPARCASPPPNSANSKPRSPTPPTARWRSSLKFSTASPPHVTAASVAIKEAADALAVVDVATALANARGRARLCAPRGRRQPRLRHRRRPPSGGRAGARHGRRPVRRQRLRSVAAPWRERREAGRIWLITGPNMAGKSTFLRQNALIAVLAQMGSFVPAQRRAYRRGRPAVLARRRRRRSRARPLDLHGRDGRDRGDPQSGRRARAGDPRRDRPRHRDLRRPLDRLGDHRASAREQPLPRAVRHPLPRDDRARREAASGCTTPPCG